jgi:uncharacterized phage-associated protein
MLTEENTVSINGTITDFGFTERFYPGKKVTNHTVFDESEMKDIRKIISYLGSKSTKEIVEQSHAEESWMENQSEKSRISYLSAFSLKAL